MERHMKGHSIPASNVLEECIMNLENKFVFSGVASRQFKQSVVRTKLFNDGLISP